MPSVEEKIGRFTYLKYMVLKNKFIYYEHPLDKKRRAIEGISDPEYDDIEAEYRQLYDELDMGIYNELHAADMVGFNKNYRDSRFAMMMVYVNAMDEREYQIYREMLIKTQNYDISAFRSVDES